MIASLLVCSLSLSVATPDPGLLERLQSMNDEMVGLDRAFPGNLEKSDGEVNDTPKGNGCSGLTSMLDCCRVRVDGSEYACTWWTETSNDFTIGTCSLDNPTTIIPADGKIHITFTTDTQNGVCDPEHELSAETKEVLERELADSIAKQKTFTSGMSALNVLESQETTIRTFVAKCKEECAKLTIQLAKSHCTALVESFSEHAFAMRMTQDLGLASAKTEAFGKIDAELQRNYPTEYSAAMATGLSSMERMLASFEADRLGPTDLERATDGIPRITLAPGQKMRVPAHSHLIKHTSAYPPLTPMSAKKHLSLSNLAALERDADASGVELYFPGDFQIAMMERSRSGGFKLLAGFGAVLFVGVCVCAGPVGLGVLGAAAVIGAGVAFFKR
jgi:hypothetical protein